jgi:glutathione S-transferase
MPLPVITYFDIRARAEPIRLILEELEIPYDDRRIDDEVWVSMKKETPFGRLPSYRDGNLEIFQSHAIYRHLARTHSLYGDSEDERVRCDVIEEAFSELNALIGTAPWRQNFEKTRVDFVAKELSPRLGQLERFLETNPLGTEFWVGSSITFVDLIAFAHLDCTGVMFPEAMAAHPTLLKFCDGISSRPRIAAYLGSDRWPSATQYGPRGKIFDSDL